MGMKPKPALTSVAITVLLALFIIFPNCRAETTRSYELLNHTDGSQNYRLNVAISDSFYDYYVGKNHHITSETDFAKFVTPYALDPIADSLGQIYSDKEDFTNGVLMIVHQISYEATVPSKYPVETIVDNKGDCDLFSFVAASILKAGGLDVVLVYYEKEAHMNLGVHLQHPPQDARSQITYVTHDNMQYYIAECTGGEWRTGWRVGECPESLIHASSAVITLDGCEQSAPSQVTASYHSLQPSSITASIDNGMLVQGDILTLSGQLTPALENRTVVIYVKANGATWQVLDTTTTDTNGFFQYRWSVDVSGVCYIRASWSGDETYAAADSQIKTVTILSTLLIMLAGLAIVTIPLAIIASILSKQAKQGAPVPPEPPPENT